MYDFKSLVDKNVLVTGVSGSIGGSIARAFIECGANVFLWGHKEKTDIYGYRNYQSVELENKENIISAYNQINGNIEVLINCAGYTFGCDNIPYPISEWEKTLSIDLYAPFILSQLVATNMINKGIRGSIINITSIGAEVAMPDNPAYAAAKGGLKQLSKALAFDYSKYGIRVNCVGPGYTCTKMTQKSWNDEEKRKQRSNRIMLGRWAQPEDIVGTVLFLCSDLATYITGQDIYVDGGWVTKGI